MTAAARGGRPARLLLLAGALLALLALLLPAAPADARRGAGAKHRGVVLDVDRSTKRLQVLEGRTVRGYRVRGRISRKVRAGSRVVFRARGRRAAGLRVRGRARRASFTGDVVDTGGEGIDLEVGDGAPFTLDLGTVSLDLSELGLDEGDVVQVTIRFGEDGITRIRIRVVREDDDACREDEDAKTGESCDEDGPFCEDAKEDCLPPPPFPPPPPPPLPCVPWLPCEDGVAVLPPGCELPDLPEFRTGAPLPDLPWCEPDEDDDGEPDPDEPEPDPDER